jgi:hypothetical protein
MPLGLSAASYSGAMIKKPTTETRRRSCVAKRDSTRTKGLFVFFLQKKKILILFLKKNNQKTSSSTLRHDACFFCGFAWGLSLGLRTTGRRAGQTLADRAGRSGQVVVDAPRSPIALRSAS